MLRVAVIGLVTGCGFSIDGSGAPEIDAPPGAIDAPPGTVDAPPAMIDAAMMIDAPGPVGVVSCVGTFETVCIVGTPPAAFNVNGGSPLSINTDSASECRAPATGSTVGPACVIVAATISLSANLRATGSRPLILIGTSSININGGAVVDVASRGLERGAGARACPAGGGPGNGAGGGGASFQTSGGSGGAGAGGNPGSVPMTLALSDLVGGCTGMNGGGLVANQGIGGLGGGAVLLIAPSIIVNGTINASGSGGGGGLVASSGGGGGGSGGAIVLDTSGLTLNGGSVLMAQGGGGGEGAATLVPGNAGSSPSASSPGTAAQGGRDASGSAGDGGDGAVSSGASNGGSGSDGGGGGGGGAGHIVTTDSSPNGSGMSYPSLDN